MIRLASPALRRPSAPPGPHARALARGRFASNGLPTYFSNPAKPPAAGPEPAKRADGPPRTYITFMLTTALISVSVMLGSAQTAQRESEEKAQQLAAMLSQNATTHQMKFTQFRQQHDSALQRERREREKIDMAVLVHVAMLRKQLVEAGIEPAGVDEAATEFQRAVRMDSSAASSGLGSSYYVATDSAVKAYIPDIHEYKR
ncbi:uncharacterized protein V1510DRAFT_414346 [Dipodascopsis tothii]|uniref:uncharacterized protein n=1 Tax=Dipodascopsis tothii TaxID=44089 RepID=UPI0034CE9EEE